MSKEITAEELRESSDKVFLIDLMSNEDFQANHIPGAINIPVDELANRIDEIPKDKPVVVACRKGLTKSDLALQQLTQSGIENAKKLQGGTVGWFESEQSKGS